jgi:hypothetical protein
MLYLVAKITDAGIGEVTRLDSMAIGKITKHSRLLDKRSMFNIRSKTPVWLLLSYIGVVGIVWGTIFYILFQLRGIRMLNKINQNGGSHD